MLSWWGHRGRPSTHGDPSALAKPWGHTEAQDRVTPCLPLPAAWPGAPGATVGTAHAKDASVELLRASPLGATRFRGTKAFPLRRRVWLGAGAGATGVPENSAVPGVRRALPLLPRLPAAPGQVRLKDGGTEWPCRRGVPEGSEGTGVTARRGGGPVPSRPCGPGAPGRGAAHCLCLPASGLLHSWGCPGAEPPHSPGGQSGSGPQPQR